MREVFADTSFHVSKGGTRLWGGFQRCSKHGRAVYQRSLSSHVTGSARCFGALQAYNPVVSNFSINYLQNFSGEGKQGKTSQFDQFWDPSKIHVSIILTKGRIKKQYQTIKWYEAYTVYIYIYTYLYLYIKIPMFFFHVFGTLGEALMNSILQGDVEWMPHGFYALQMDEGGSLTPRRQRWAFVRGWTPTPGI